jgi:hypothetical protein
MTSGPLRSHCLPRGKTGTPKKGPPHGRATEKIEPRVPRTGEGGGASLSTARVAGRSPAGNRQKGAGAVNSKWHVVFLRGKAVVL